MIPEALRWEAGALDLLDQQRLPAAEVWTRYHTCQEVARAIRALVVRGAPAIGIAAAYGVALAAGNGSLDSVRAGARQLLDARPTAVNLRWAVERMLTRAAELAAGNTDLAGGLAAEAVAIHAEDRQMCRAIGEHGLKLLGERPRVLTHCNAGALATGGIGTALAPFYLAHEAGRPLKVYACEARPVLQGARLTSWELSRAGIDVSLLVDGAAAFLLSRGEIDSVWVGADRIAANGDVANKIGTLALACAAHRYKVPFYVAAPRSTFDPNTPTGADIEIEFRAPEEFQERFAERVNPSGISYWAPAFDVTPSELVTAYVSDRGTLTPSELQKA